MLKYSIKDDDIESCNSSHGCRLAKRIGDLLYVMNDERIYKPGSGEKDVLLDGVPSDSLDFHVFEGKVWVLFRQEEDFVVRSSKCGENFSRGESHNENVSIIRKNVRSFFFEGPFFYFLIEEELYQLELKTSKESIIFHSLKGTKTVKKVGDAIIHASTSNIIYMSNVVSNDLSSKSISRLPLPSPVVDIISDNALNPIVSVCEDNKMWEYETNAGSRRFLFDFLGKYLTTEISRDYIALLSDLGFYVFGRKPRRLLGGRFLFGNGFLFCGRVNLRDENPESIPGKDIFLLKDAPLEITPAWGLEKVIDKNLVFIRGNCVLFYDEINKLVTNIIEVKEKVSRLFVSNEYLIFSILEKRKRRDHHQLKLYKFKKEKCVFHQTISVEYEVLDVVLFGDEKVAILTNKGLIVDGRILYENVKSIHEYKGELLLVDERGVKQQSGAYIYDSSPPSKAFVSNGYLFVNDRIIDLERRSEMKVFKDKPLLDYRIEVDGAVTAVKDEDGISVEEYLLENGEWVFHRKVEVEKSFSCFISARTYATSDCKYHHLGTKA